jgi:NADH-quinone oxidoreductase subunit N
MGKLLVLEAGVGASLWALAAILCAGSVIGAYYYLRVIVVLCRTGAEPSASEAGAAEEDAPAPALPASPLAAGIALAAMAALLLGLGVYPGPLIAIIQGLFAQ